MACCLSLINGACVVSSVLQSERQASSRTAYDTHGCNPPDAGIGGNKRSAANRASGCAAAPAKRPRATRTEPAASRAQPRLQPPPQPTRLPRRGQPPVRAAAQKLQRIALDDSSSSGGGSDYGDERTSGSDFELALVSDREADEAPSFDSTSDDGGGRSNQRIAMAPALRLLPLLPGAAGAATHMDANRQQTHSVSPQQSRAAANSSLRLAAGGASAAIQTAGEMADRQQAAVEPPAASTVPDAEEAVPAGGTALAGARSTLSQRHTREARPAVGSGPGPATLARQAADATARRAGAGGTFRSARCVAIQIYNKHLEHWPLCTR